MSHLSPFYISIHARQSLAAKFLIVLVAHSREIILIYSFKDFICGNDDGDAEINPRFECTIEALFRSRSTMSQ